MKRPRFPTRRQSRGAQAGLRDEAPDGFGSLRVAQIHVLQDRVAVGSGSGRIEHRGDELLLGQADVSGCSRQTVALQALVDRGEQRPVLTQEGSEKSPDAGELAVVAGPRGKVLDGMEDLVVSATAWPAR